MTFCLQLCFAHKGFIRPLVRLQYYYTSSDEPEETDRSDTFDVPIAASEQ